MQMVYRITMEMTLHNNFQVFDLGETAPDKVLHGLYGNLERLKSKGHGLAAKVEEKLRIIVSCVLYSMHWV